MLLASRAVLRGCFSAVSSLSRYLEPYSLHLQEATHMPKIQLRSQDELLKNWWSLSPFDLPHNEPMTIPVFSFKEGTYLQQQVGTH